MASKEIEVYPTFPTGSLSNAPSESNVSEAPGATHAPSGLPDHMLGMSEEAQGPPCPRLAPSASPGTGRISDPVPSSWLPNWPCFPARGSPGQDALFAGLHTFPWSGPTEPTVQRSVPAAAQDPLPLQAAATNNAGFRAPIAPWQSADGHAPRALKAPATHATDRVGPEPHSPYTLQHIALQLRRLAEMDLALQRDDPLLPRVAADALRAAAYMEGWPVDLHLQYVDLTTQPPMAIVLRSVPGQTEDSPPPDGVSILRDRTGTLTSGPVHGATDLMPRIPGSAPLDYVDALLTALRFANSGPFKVAIQALLKNTNTVSGQVHRELDGNGRATGAYKDLLRKILLKIQDKGRLTQSLARQHQEVLLRQSSPAP